MCFAVFRDVYVTFLYLSIWTLDFRPCLGSCPGKHATEAHGELSKHAIISWVNQHRRASPGFGGVRAPEFQDLKWPKVQAGADTSPLLPQCGSGSIF